MTDAVRVEELVEVAVELADVLLVAVPDEDRDLVAEPVPVAEGVDVGLAVLVAEPDCEKEPVEEADVVPLRVTDALADPELV